MVLHHPDRGGEHDTMQLVNRARGLVPTHHRLPVQGPLPCPDGSSGGLRRSAPDHQERPACGRTPPLCIHQASLSLWVASRCAAPRRCDQPHRGKLVCCIGSSKKKAPAIGGGRRSAGINQPKRAALIRPRSLRLKPKAAPAPRMGRGPGTDSNVLVILSIPTAPPVTT